MEKERREGTARGSWAAACLQRQLAALHAVFSGQPSREAAERCSGLFLRRLPLGSRGRQNLHKVSLERELPCQSSGRCVFIVSKMSIFVSI